MQHRIVVIITPQGVESIDIHADTEQDQVVLEQLLDRIRPCLDVADAIIRKTDPGARG